MAVIERQHVPVWQAARDHPSGVRGDQAMTNLSRPANVKLVHPPEWDEKTYGNPQFFNFLHTVASMATRGYFKPMRKAGAQARRVLLDAMATKWDVPVGELSSEPSIVVHKASGRRIS